MAKITKYILIQILFLSCAYNVGYCLEIEGDWIPEKIDWQSPDIEGLEKIRYASLSIMQFQKDGTFKLFQYIVYAGDNGSINISYTEGGNIFKGIWEPDKNNEIHIKYKEIYRAIPRRRIDGGKLETEFTKSYTLETTNENLIKIKTDKEIFIKSERLTKESKEFMAKY